MWALLFFPKRNRERLNDFVWAEALVVELILRYTKLKQLLRDVLHKANRATEVDLHVVLLKGGFNFLQVYKTTEVEIFPHLVIYCWLVVPH